MSLADGKLIETLRAACNAANGLNHKPEDRDDSRFTEALEALSQPDALAWALLEEMAERVKVTSGLPSGNVTTFGTYSKGGVCSFRDRDGFYLTKAAFHDWMTPPLVKEHILNLARAIKEQEGRGQDV